MTVLLETEHFTAISDCFSPEMYVLSLSKLQLYQVLYAITTATSTKMSLENLSSVYILELLRGYSNLVNFYNATETVQEQNCWERRSR